MLCLHRITTDKRGVTMTDVEPIVGDVPCAWLYLPVPQNLGLPHDYSVTFASPMAEIVGGHRLSPVSSSVRVLQVPLTVPADSFRALELSQAVMDATDHQICEPEGPCANRDHSKPDLEIRSDGELDVPAVVTLLEVGLVEPPIEGCDQFVNDAIEIAQTLQSAYAVVTQGPVRLLTRPQLPVFIHIVRGSVEPFTGVPTYDSLELHPNFESALSDHDLPDPPLDAEGLEVLEAVLDDLGSGRAFFDYTDLRREAFVQDRLDGNERLAVATLATAGEVFVDELILHLMWSEGVDPYVAIGAIDPLAAHAARVQQELPSRLGGNWDPKGTGPVGRYFRQLVYLRHRVVHAGYTPTRDEVAKARDALLGLEQFVGDRLCHHTNLVRLIRTAMAFLGNRGIEKRNAWSRRMEEITNDTAQPIWSTSFSHWKRHVHRALDPAPPAPGSDPRHVALSVGAGEDGEDFFAIHDSLSLHAAVVPADEFVRPEDQHVVAVFLRERSVGDIGRLGLPMNDGVVLTGLAWMKDYEVYPMFTVTPG